eukprot:GILJ01002685.1.p1 GENE.GILJ01002685.1~~GILJ01002685.1.p1  ORF type:complete len:280 (+),score=34.08 GILJ01002685.1:62-841(+)
MEKKAQFNDLVKNLKFYNGHSLGAPKTENKNATQAKGFWQDKGLGTGFGLFKGADQTTATPSTTEANDVENPAESSTLLSWAKNAANASVNSVKNLKTSASNSTASVRNIATAGQRLKVFVALLVIGLICFFLAFSFLPLVVLRPSKFALLFTIGSLCFMGSFAFLRGPLEHAKYLFSMERLPFTLTYFGSMLLTLYASLIAQSYIMVVVFAVCQIFALLWYSCSYFPGGTRGMQFITKMIAKSCQKLLDCGRSRFLPL